MNPRLRTLTGLLLVAGVFACKSDATSPADNGGNPTGNPTLSLSISPSSISIAQGANGSVGITVTRGGGFSGAATLSVEGTPTGVTATPSPASVAAGSTTATLALSVGASVSAGSYSLTVRAKGSGVSDATTTLSLTVTAVSNGAFTLSLDPTALSLAQGASGTATVTIARSGGFAGAVALTATGLPGGMTAAFDPASATAGSSTLTITVGASVTAGSYSVVVHGTGSGVSEQTATLTVTVTQPSAGNLTWSFCPAVGIPVWFAVQDGGGSWTAVAPVANAYSFGISSGKGGVAYVLATGTEYTLNLQYGTTQELMQLGAALCASTTTGTKTVMGTVQNIGVTEQAFITFGGASAVVFGGVNSFTLQDVLDGPGDLVAGRVAIGLGGGTVTYTLNAGVIMRGINPPNGSTITVDFAGAQSFTPEMHNLTIGNLGTDVGQITASFITAGGSTGALYTDAGGSAQAARQYAGVPASAMQSGDLHQLTVSAFDMNGTPSAFRWASKLFATAADETVTLGPALGNVTMTVAATTPYVRPRAQYTIQSEYNRYWYAGWSQSAGAATRAAVLAVSAGYLGSTSSFDFVLPDFSAVAGWNNLWGFVTGSALGWQLFGSGWSAPGGYGGVPNLDGATSMAAFRIGSITP
ncbi:MAG: hypothetical protein PVH00_06555 [Gemmatimonadota bacterium]